VISKVFDLMARAEEKVRGAGIVELIGRRDELDDVVPKLTILDVSIPETPHLNRQQSMTPQKSSVQSALKEKPKEGSRSALRKVSSKGRKDSGSREEGCSRKGRQERDGSFSGERRGSSSDGYGETKSCGSHLW